MEVIADFLFTGLLLVSGFVFLFAAFQLILAGGDPMAVAGARQRLLFAVIGIILAFFALAIPNIIANILGGVT